MLTNYSKTEVVADTSSLISLQTGGVLELSLDLFDVSIPEIVVTELKDVAGYDDAHGKSARYVLRLIKEDKISVREVISISETESRVESRVDAGEMSCLNLCRQEQIPILVTDDWRALPKLIEISLIHKRRSLCICDPRSTEQTCAGLRWHSQPEPDRPYR